jgi:hypothetical protein
MTAMKGNALKSNKATVRKQKKSASSKTATMQRKVRQTFAEQVEAFIERYRPP